MGLSIHTSIVFSWRAPRISLSEAFSAGGLEVLKSGGNPQGVLEGATRHIVDADGVGNVAKGGDDGVGGAGLGRECERGVGSRGGGFQRCDRALKQVAVMVVRAGVCVALWARVGLIRVEEQHAR